jgi:hypothetical protein
VLTPPREGTLGIPLGELRGVRIHRVDQELDGRLAAAGLVAREVPRDDDPGVEAPLAERPVEVGRGRVVPAHPEAAALGKDGDQLAALGRPALVHHAEAEVPDLGIEDEPEEQDLERRGDDQREDEATVPEDLAQFLQGQRPEWSAPEDAEASHHAVTCIRRIVRHASA